MIARGGIPSRDLCARTVCVLAHMHAHMKYDKHSSSIIKAKLSWIFNNKRIIE